jgi:hypothetical protein
LGANERDVRFSPDEPTSTVPLSRSVKGPIADMTH